MESYAGMAPHALDSLGPAERRQVYKMLMGRVAAYPDAWLEVGGIMTNPTSVCNTETSRVSNLSLAHTHLITFSARLRDGAWELRFEKAAVG